MQRVFLISSCYVVNTVCRRGIYIELLPVNEESIVQYSKFYRGNRQDFIFSLMRVKTIYKTRTLVAVAVL